MRHRGPQPGLPTGTHPAASGSAGEPDTSCPTQGDCPLLGWGSQPAGHGPPPQKPAPHPALCLSASHAGDPADAGGAVGLGGGTWLLFISPTSEGIPELGCERVPGGGEAGIGVGWASRACCNEMQLRWSSLPFLCISPPSCGKAPLERRLLLLRRAPGSADTGIPGHELVPCRGARWCPLHRINGTRCHHTDTLAAGPPPPSPASPSTRMYTGDPGGRRGAALGTSKTPSPWSQHLPHQVLASSSGPAGYCCCSVAVICRQEPGAACLGAGLCSCLCCLHRSCCRVGCLADFGRTRPALAAAGPMAWPRHRTHTRPGSGHLSVWQTPEFQEHEMGKGGLCLPSLQLSHPA